MNNNENKTLLTPHTIITGHINADFDAIAAMVAASKLYPGAAMIFPGSKERAVNSFFMQGASFLFEFHLPKEVDFSQVTTLVAVDTKQKSRLEHIAEVFKNPELKIHIYDHHPSSADDLKADFDCTKMWGATTSIIAHKLMEKGVELTRDEATLLGIGIYEDTGFLTFPATCQEDFIAAGWLRSQNMDLNTISELMQHTMTPEQVALLHTMLENAVIHEIKGIPVVMMDVSLETFVGDFSAVVQQAMQMTQAKVIFALAIMADKVQIIARSRVPEVDTGRICTTFGGGGHAGAASASVKDKTLAEIKDAIFGLLYSQINPDILVHDIMTSPVHFVYEDHTIAEAEEIMLRYVLKAMPVVDPQTLKCTGIIEHQLAARALVHELGDQKISEYMNRSITMISSNSSLYSLMELVIDEDQRLVPVVKNERIIGVVSRTDILQTLLEDSARIPESVIPGNQKEKNIQAMLGAQLPEEYQLWLKMAGQLGDELGMEVYAVGGFVRDILLHQPNFDLDLVVEGDGIVFARALGKKLKGRVKAHHEFKTAVVVFNNQDGVRQRIDVATARLEYYKHPAAMPTIELSSIKMDLYRRDFTINALAMHLNPERYGLLVDFFGSQRDIKDRIIRVLHALSFVEDPTRILRAIRFEQRFEFHLSSQTERLIKNALHLNVFEKLSGGRIFNELQLIMEEDSPLACFKRMEKLKLSGIIQPLLRLTPPKEQAFLSMEKTLAWYQLSYLTPKPEPWICYFLCLCNNCKYLEVSGLLERLNFPDKERKDFLSWREELGNAIKEVNKWHQNSTSMSSLHALLYRLPLEALLYILANTESEEKRRPLIHYITSARNAHVDISGEDLIALGGRPGPGFGEILNRVLKAKLDGQAVSRTAQLNLARELLDSGDKIVNSSGNTSGNKAGNKSGNTLGNMGK